MVGKVWVAAREPAAMFIITPIRRHVCSPNLNASPANGSISGSPNSPMEPFISGLEVGHEKFRAFSLDSLGEYIGFVEDKGKIR